MTKPLVKRETRHIVGMAKTLTQLAKEVNKMGYFDEEHRVLLGRIGARLAFQSAVAQYKEGLTK